MASIDTLLEFEKKILWLSSQIIHNANHCRLNDDGIKVGGHQASSASLVTIMTALYLRVLKPEDRVAVKPHASPVFHAIQYLLGNQTLENLKNFRGYGGAQSYPSRTKDVDDVDFSTGSVGLGVAVTAFASLVQDYIKSHGWLKNWPTGKMVALMGDAELDEGNIYECLLEAWKHNLRNCWWIIDYNRQSLDSIVNDQLFDKHRAVFKNFGWKVITLKYGKLQKAAFEKPGGEQLRNWIDTCPNVLYSALVFQGGEKWRSRLIQDLADSPETVDLINTYDDTQLHAVMTNLGGHCLESVLEAFEHAPSDQPVCFIAYTVKGRGLPLQGHKDNHAGLMSKAQMQQFQEQNNIAQGQEWEPFSGLHLSVSALEKSLADTPFNQKGSRRFTADKVPCGTIPVPSLKGEMSTQEGFGKLLAEIAKEDTAFADRIVTTSPDVTVSTNLGGWVNRRALYSRAPKTDMFRELKLMSAQRWDSHEKGQHLELGIAENNLFLNLAALGLSHSLFGERLIPIGTLYDPFIARGLDALNYACYQDSRFILVSTPSGITLAPEGGAHQSIGTPLIGMTQPGLVSFEPTYVDELATILEWGFDFMQRDKTEATVEDPYSGGGSLYFRLSTRPIEQLARELSPEDKENIIKGAYWMRTPRHGTDLVIAYTGVMGPEAADAMSQLLEKSPDAGLLAITSADRLYTDWQHAVQRRRGGHCDAVAHIETLLAPVGMRAQFITVLDGHSAALTWLGAVYGNPTHGLGVSDFGQTGNLEELYAHYKIDAQAIIETCLMSIPDGRHKSNFRRATI